VPAPCRECDSGQLSRRLVELLPNTRVTAGGIEYGTHDVNSS